MIRLMLSAFQSIMSAQLSVSQTMSPSENFLKAALCRTHGLYQTANDIKLFVTCYC